jgi:hypothetical protein
MSEKLLKLVESYESLGFVRSDAIQKAEEELKQEREERQREREERERERKFLIDFANTYRNLEGDGCYR